MEEILSFVNMLIQMLNSVNDFLGMEIQLILPVIVAVSLISRGFKVRQRFKDTYKIMLALLVVAVAGLVQVLIGDVQGFGPALRAGLMLGSVSALTYQFWKPLFKKLGQFISSRTGQEVKEEDTLV